MEALKWQKTRCAREPQGGSRDNEETHTISMPESHQLPPRPIEDSQFLHTGIYY